MTIFAPSGNGVPDKPVFGLNLASLGLGMSGVALLALITGQRFAKDYAGAAVVAAYFAVDLVGLLLFT